MTNATHGPVFRPGDAAFDEEKAALNLWVDHRPSIVVGATGTADVISAVRYALEEAKPIAVQATGHGVVYAADDAVFISTRRMTGVRVDPVTRTARVEAGVPWGKVVHEAAEHGLAPLNGSSGAVGAVGYVIGGGLPLLGRKFGYAADHVRAFDLVNADGMLCHVTGAAAAGKDGACDDEAAELFWGLRGGAGNFGIVVSMEIDLMPVPRLYGGGLYFPGESTAALLHRYRAWVDEMPEAMASSFLIANMPNLPHVDAALRGRFVCHVRIAYAGMTDDGERLIAPLRAAAPRLLDTVRDMPYRDVASIHHEPSVPVTFYGRNSLLRALDDRAIDSLLAHAGPDARAPYFVEIRHLGGALSREPRVPNAVGGRDAAFSLYSGGMFTPDQLSDVRAAHDALHQAMQPWATGGVCMNFIGGPETTVDDVRAAFRPEDFARLQRLKARHDPRNLFRFNRNIPPA